MAGQVDRYFGRRWQVPENPYFDCLNPQPTDGMNKLTGIMHTVLRVVTAMLVMQHGIQKLFGLLVPPGAPWPEPRMFSAFWIAGVLEVFGAALVALGLFTRPVALLIALEMAAYYLRDKIPVSFFPILNNGDHLLMFSVAMLYLFAAGPGPYSLDSIRERRRVYRQGTVREVQGTP